MQEALKACSNVSASGPDHITWWYLKHILSNKTYTVGIISLANACLSLHHWPRHFKELVSVIMPKPAYNTLKVFRPIVLLNTQISNPRYTGDTWNFTLIEACPSRNMFSTTLPRHYQWSKQ